jgi:hypothetical protein
MQASQQASASVKGSVSTRLSTLSSRLNTTSRRPLAGFSRKKRALLA